jgi:hypothetical protein
MKLTDRIIAAPQVVAREVGAETVLLDLESGTYFGLDPVGTRIWALLEQGKSIAEVCGVMLEEFEVPRDVLERDALALIADLAQKKLITIA